MSLFLEVLGMIPDLLFLGKTQHRRTQMDRFQARTGWFFYAFPALVAQGAAVVRF